MSDLIDFPRLRGVDIRPSTHQPDAVDMIDRSCIARSIITISRNTLTVLAMMNGRRRRSDIQAEFMRKTGRMLFSDELDELIGHLEEAHFLAGPRFEAHWSKLTREYRASSMRHIRDLDALGAPRRELAGHLDRILAERPKDLSSSNHDGLIGMIAPHLDYHRGGPCYAAAYRELPQRTKALRFVVLGTNHFGCSAGVVGTAKDFETPWGSVPHDAAFMRRLAERCGVDLCEFEYDHVGEHSVELQVVLLKHIFGPREFTIAPYLCPDPCGSTGTNPHDGHGVDLNVFARALAEEITADGISTCIIAGADLSHVGRFFDGNRDLDESYLREIEHIDRAAIQHLINAEPERFRASIAATSNTTSICSVGCIYALATALHGRARPRFLHYHQAVVPEVQNCVTCAAIEYLRT